MISSCLVNQELVSLQKEETVLQSNLTTQKTRLEGDFPLLYLDMYWVPQKLPQIYTVIVYFCIGKVA